MIDPLEPKLPQNDPMRAHRARTLEDARETYKYTYQWPPGVATAKEVPSSDTYSLGYIAGITPSAVQLFENTVALGGYLVKEHELRTLAARERASMGELSGPAAGAWYLRLPARLASYVRDEPVRSVDVYSTLHQTLEAPAVQSRWDDDEVFAWQRIAGVNPMTLRRVASLPDYVAISEADVARSKALTTTLARAIGEGTVFACDYTLLAGARTGRTNNRRKWLPAPYALFAAVGGKLRPIAIQLAKGASSAVCVPGDGQRWTVARLAVQVADANVHETIEHLGRTHMVMEAVTLAMKRQLASEHPLRKLLEPHTEFTLAINHSAATNLIAPDGVVDQAFAGAIDASASLVRFALDTFDLRRSVPTKALVDRGLDDRAVLTTLPYRDDALDVFAVIERFAREYVRLYYPSADEIREDDELRAFVEELTDDAGGRLSGVGAVDTPESLAEVLAAILWTATAQHAAVNFPQYPYMGALPNMAGAFWSQWPPNDLDESGLIEKLMPPYNMAMAQVYTVLQLSSLRLTRLGEFGPAQFLHGPAREVVASFANELERLEVDLRARDATRFLSYPFLFPSNIPGSIHI